MLPLLIAGLTLTAAPADSADSVVYVLTALSRFEVRVGKSGMFGFLGHDHLIRAHAARGRVVYHPVVPADSRVEIVVLADFRFGATPEQVVARPGWSGIPAVRNRAIYPIDDDLVSRPGPRLVLGFEAYAKIIHPELFGTP